MAKVRRFEDPQCRQNIGLIAYLRKAVVSASPSQQIRKTLERYGIENY
jgi:hypothetical protein